MEGLILIAASFLPAIAYEIAIKNDETEPEDSAADQLTLN